MLGSHHDGGLGLFGGSLEVDILLGSIIVPTTFPEVPTRIFLAGGHYRCYYCLFFGYCHYIDCITGTRSTAANMNLSSWSMRVSVEKDTCCWRLILGRFLAVGGLKSNNSRQSSSKPTGPLIAYLLLNDFARMSEPSVIALTRVVCC